MRQNQVCDQEKWIGIKFTIQKVGLKSTFDPESRAKIHFRSILWVWNPFFWFEMPCFDPENWFVVQVMVQKIHFRSILWVQNPFFDLKCPVLIRKIDLLSRLWFKSLRLVSIYLRFLKIVCVWFILCPYETRWLPKGYWKVTDGLLKGYRWVTDGLPKGCCLGCKLLYYWKLNEVKNNAYWMNHYRL